MGGLRLRPQKCDEVRRALRELGFEFKRQGRGSHEHWEGVVDGQRRLVTLDCHKGRVRPKDLRSIISQSSVKRREFLKYL